MRLSLRSLFASFLALSLSLSVVACAAEGEASTEEESFEDAESEMVTDGLHTPEIGDAENTAIVAGIHANIDPKLGGQKAELVIGRDMWVQNGWAFVRGYIQGKNDGSVDWSKTSWKQSVEAAAFDTDGHGRATFTAVLRLQTSHRWKVAVLDGASCVPEEAIAVGATDVRWVHWRDVLVAKRNAPKAIFVKP